MPPVFSYPPRGMRRQEAARYIGLGASKFDQLVKESRLPCGQRVDGCVIWDVRALDEAFDALMGQDVAPKMDPEDETQQKIRNIINAKKGQQRAVA